MQMGEKNRYYLLYNLYSYRLYLAIKNKFFSSEKKFKLNFLNKCDDNKKYSNYKEFLKNYFNSEVYESYKYSSENKPQPYDRKTKKLTEFKIWKQNLIKNYNNKFLELNNDFFNWNRSIYSAEELSKIKLTNSLLKEIQKISNENNAKFIIFFPVIDHERLFPFKDDYTYLICKNGNEIGYSNQNVYERLDLIFENIENVYIYRDIIQKNWYDAFDGHPKPEVNKILMKKLSEYIKNLELD